MTGATLDLSPDEAAGMAALLAYEDDISHAIVVAKSEVKLHPLPPSLASDNGAPKSP